MTVTTLDFMRHGVPVGGRRFRGGTDDPLSEEGWAEVERTVGDYRGWNRIVTSPMKRCRPFAEALAERLSVPLEVEPRFAEMRFGSWEGKTPAELRESDPDALRRMRRDALAGRPADAEPLPAAYARVAAAFDDLAERAYGEHALVVCHGGIIRMVLAKVLSIPLSRTFRVQVSSAAITRIAVEGRGADAVASLLFHDGHLPLNRRQSD